MARVISEAFVTPKSPSAADLPVGTWFKGSHQYVQRGQRIVLMFKASDKHYSVIETCGDFYTPGTYIADASGIKVDRVYQPGDQFTLEI